MNEDDEWRPLPVQHVYTASWILNCAKLSDALNYTKRGPDWMFVNYFKQRRYV